MSDQLYSLIGICFLVLLIMPIDSLPNISKNNNVNITSGSKHVTNSNGLEEDAIPELRCWEEYDSNGTNITLIEETLEAKSLNSLNFDDKIASCCFKGGWLMYEAENFTINIDVEEYTVLYGEGDCINVPEFFYHLASSVRYFGVEDNYRKDSLTLYEEQYFGGETTTTTVDLKTLHKRANDNRYSAIITGSTPWTIYEDDDFIGDRYCLYPSDMKNRIPGFYETDLGGLRGVISSVKKGCSE